MNERLHFFKTADTRIFQKNKTGPSLPFARHQTGNELNSVFLIFIWGLQWVNVEASTVLDSLYSGRNRKEEGKSAHLSFWNYMV